MAWGIEPRLSLDKKTHDALQSESCASVPLVAPSCNANSGLTGDLVIIDNLVWVYAPAVEKLFLHLLTLGTSLVRIKNVEHIRNRNVPAAGLS